MNVHWWEWLALSAAVVVMLGIDLLLFNRRKGEVPLRAALIWSIVWTAIGFAFTALLAWGHGWKAGEEYLAGFVLEKSLSTDNLFVFALVFTAFGVPPLLQRRVLFWGIVGAILLRAAFIFAGAALLDAFHYTLYVFAAFLVYTGIKMIRHGDTEVHPEKNPVLKALGRVMPISHDLDGQHFTVKKDGKRMATPLLGALVLVATFDVIFAVDSIPAIFAVTRETFIVLAANAFSLLGLSALYFLLVGSMDKFRYLKPALAIILVVIGVKMLLVDVVHVPVAASLGLIVAILAGAVLLSLKRPPAPTAGEV